MIKLPEPVGHTDAYWLATKGGGHFSKQTQCGNIALYTEAQLLQALRDFGEQCAQVCDAQQEASNASAAKARGVKARDIYSAAAQTAHRNAAAIRALINQI